MFQQFIEDLLVVWARILTVGHKLAVYVHSLIEAAIIKFYVWFETASFNVASLEPGPKVALWIQIVVGVMTIIWIIFQFAWLRRLNESRLERYLEGTISSEHDELADERTTTLAELDRVVKRRGLQQMTQ